MNFKTTIVLIVLLAFAGAALFFTRDTGTKEDAAKTVADAQKLFNVADSDVTKIDIASADGKKLVLEKASGKWRLLKPVAAPAEAFEVDSLVRALTGLTSHGQVDSSSADAKATGLANPRYTIEITAKEGKQTLLVGDKLAIGDNLYVARKDERLAVKQADNNTRVVSADFLERLEKPATDYRDKKLVTDYSTAGIGQIELARPDGKLVLVKKGDDWKITEPAAMPAEKTAVDDIVFGLTGLRAAEFVSEDPTDAAMYELDRPRITATLSAAPPTTLPVGIAATQPTSAPTSQPAPVVIKFGRHDDILKKNVMVMTSQAPVIAKVSANILETLNKKPLDLRDKKVIDLDPAQVSAITISQDIAATTQPTSKPAVKRDITIRRRKESNAVTQPTTQVASTSPATTQATTQSAATKPASKWEVVTGSESKSANDGKIDSLVNLFHPLRARKYFEKEPTTKPAGTFVVKITTEGPGGTPVNNYELTFVDPGRSGEPTGTYNGLAFETDRGMIQNVGGEFIEGARPPAGVGHEAEPSFPSDSTGP